VLQPPKPEFSRLNTHNGATHRSKCPARTAAPVAVAGAGQCTGVHLGNCRATSCYCRKPGGAHTAVDMCFTAAPGMLLGLGGCCGGAGGAGIGEGDVAVAGSGEGSGVGSGSGQRVPAHQRLAAGRKHQGTTTAQQPTATHPRCPSPPPSTRERPLTTTRQWRAVQHEEGSGC
jgi:hypothetical protein